MATPHRTQEGNIAEGERAFDKLPPVTVPTLVLPNGHRIDAALMYEKPNANKRNTVIYNVHLIDRNGNKVNLPDECILCFPYPKGMDELGLNKYRIVIHHDADDGKTEVFKSEEGDIELTKQGICIRITSLSPFEITWEELPKVELPKTGDNSQFELWLVVLALAGMILLAFRRTIA